ncbi:MAG: YhgE/Pip family protein [Massiliimalia sp.]|jgi:putative membrane protein
MKQAFRIFVRDVSRIGRSWVACLVVIGVCLIPSLYAWFNIAANYDPYSNTQGVQISIVNEDRGIQHSLTGELNAGDEIVKNLKENHDLGWVFEEKNTAIEGVESGEYYAALLIPENFSESLVSILSGTIQRPEIVYYVNEKKNAIAPKITDTGASTILEQVNEEFVSAASQSASELINQSAKQLSQQADEAEQDVITKLETILSHLDRYEQSMGDFESGLEKMSSDLGEITPLFDQASEQAKIGAEALKQSAELFLDGQESLQDFQQNLRESVWQGGLLLENIGDRVQGNLSFFQGQMQTAVGKVDDAANTLEQVLDQNEQLIQGLKNLDEMMPGSPAQSLIASLEEDNQRHQKLLEQLKTGNQSLGDIMNAVTTASAQLAAAVSGNQELLSQADQQFQQEILPQFQDFMSTFLQENGQLSGTIEGVIPSIEQMKVMTNSLSSSLEQAKTAIKSTSDSIVTIKNQLGDTLNDIQTITQSQTFGEALLSGTLDVQAISDFMSAPVTLKTETFYSVKNYGSAMTPFYTNLAIWVGGMVLIAIFKLEVDQEGLPVNCSLAQRYFGRWILYILIGQIQAIIIVLGNLFLLKVQCVSPWALLLAGMVCSFVYVNIIYALSTTFKHIGKALSVLLVIIQIPGSAGTYPIEMTPGFFQNLHPFLPFTYGVNAMREAVAGIYGNHYGMDLLILFVYVPLSLLIGLGIRPLLLNLNHMFDLKLSQTELMICEEPGKEKLPVRLRTMVRVLMNQQEFKNYLHEKALKFEAKYKRRIRIGFVGIVVIPLIFLILMLRVNSKMVFLSLWIVSMIVISGYLMLIEYLHTRLQQDKTLVETWKPSDDQQVPVLQEKGETQK